MALFKVYRGSEANLPQKKTDGWAYFCSDTCNFYIDLSDADGTLYRKQISGDYAGRLRYIDGDSYVEISAEDIKAALTKLDSITDDRIIGWDGKSKCYFSKTQPAEMTANDLWVEIIE